MSARLLGSVAIWCVVLWLLPGQSLAVTDDMEQDLWTFVDTNAEYDGTAEAGYSTADCTSPTRSIRLSLSGGGEVGLDGDTVYATRTFAVGAQDQNLRLSYNVAQQTDGDGWGGQHGAADVVVTAYDADGVALGTCTYRLAASDLHESPDWYEHMHGDAGSPCHQADVIYIGTPDAGGEYEPGPAWRTLNVVLSRDIAVDWADVASVEVKLALGSCFMHLDTFEVFFDDLAITPVPANVLIHPDTLNVKSGGRWITAYINLPAGFDVDDIDVATVALDGIPAVRGNVEDEGILMVKFERAAVAALIEASNPKLPVDVTLTVTGLVGGVPFEGSDTIRVIGPGKMPVPPPKSAKIAARRK